jgi:tetratricopeptide (TPR) repeat protein
MTTDAHKLISLLCLSFTLGGCSSIFAVKSDPLQSDVFVQSANGPKKPIGKTPLQMPMNELKKIVGDTVKSGEFFDVIVERPGYLTQTLHIPATRFGTLATILDVKLKTGTQEKEARAAKDILDHLFVAQKFALEQQFERAQVELDAILKDMPTFARALSMRASIYLAQKNYPESLKWYEEALKSDPQMDNAVKMAAKVRALQSGRVPAADATTETKPNATVKPTPKTGKRK